MLLEKQSAGKAVKLQLQLHSIAREFRQQPTLAEEKLWFYLRAKKLAGLKFKRQHPLFHYIVDFYCHARSLVIEVDGEIHVQTVARDHDRDTLLYQHGFKVLRFTNEQVLENIDQIIISIKSCVNANSSPSKERLGEVNDQERADER